MMAALRGWWALFLLPVAAAAAVPSSWPRWALMWAVATAVYAACKWVSWRRSAACAGSGPRLAGYFLAWPGMNARSFLDPAPSPPPRAPSPGEWAAAALKVAIGATLLWGLARALPPHLDLAVGWVGMIGIVTALHFGFFHMLSCAWRAAGIDAPRIMDDPAAARTLGDFWGRRWNVAFRDLTFEHLFRPLAGRVGPRAAVLLGFLASGAAHDAVISYPALGGYGLPTGYFLIQGAGLLFERGRMKRALGLGHGLVGRAWTMAIVILPAGMLFHPPFVREVVLPFMKAIGSI